MPKNKKEVVKEEPASPSRRIGDAEVRKAESLLQKYKQGKANLERRIIDNEQWWKLRHGERTRDKQSVDPEPVSAWLFNSIANKHADAMDNFPEPNILPREEGDRKDAEMLSSILPVVLEENGYEQTYSSKWTYKLKAGTGVEGVFWNPQKAGGLGDIEIRRLDLLNLFWEPGVQNIQDSPHLFYCELMNNEMLEVQYPQLKGRLGASTIDVATYIHDDSIDTSEKSMVIDWYYKVSSESGTILHYCKFCNGEVLYASEDDPACAEKGFYDHGQYPFELDPLFEVEGSPAGFGYIDVMKSAQLYIDKLNKAILKNVLMSAKKRFFIKNEGSVNAEEFADWERDFVGTTGNLGENDIREIQTSQLDSSVVNILQLKIEELKETSGNRDFSQGGTSSGVTAASAIAALQEAGSKLSRDMIKSSYRSFTRVCNLCIELIRQFYDEPRCFRITGEQGNEAFVRYDNAHIKAQDQGVEFGVELGSRVPIFDIKVRAQKSNPFSKMAQNEMAKEFFGMGFFNPQLADQALACMEMMDFEGKTSMINRIAQNGTLFQQVQMLQQQVTQLLSILGANGMIPVPEGAPMPNQGSGKAMETNPLGEAVRSASNTTADTARLRAANVAAPR